MSGLDAVHQLSHTTRPSLQSCSSVSTLPRHSHSSDSAWENTSIWAGALLPGAPKLPGFLLYPTLCCSLSPRPPHHYLCSEPLPSFLEITPTSEPTHSPLGPKANPGEWGQVAHHLPKIPILPFTHNKPHTQATHVNEQPKSSSPAGIRSNNSHSKKTLTIRSLGAWRKCLLFG